MQRGMLKSLALSFAGLIFFAASAAQAYDLPDFTALVEKNGSAVVNVQARQNGSDENAAAAGGDEDEPDQEQIPEIFRRFFGPGGPGAPGVPRGGRPGGISLGSGFIISNDGYILTNNHVVDGADSVTVRLSDRRELDAKVVGTDSQYDIALLKVTASNLPAVTLGDSKKLKPGQWVLAIGSPFGFDHSVTAGIVSAVSRSFGGRDQQYVPFIQTDVAINRGNSGGPLFNLDGEVVGINSQILSNTGGFMGVSFAIPIDTAMSAVKQIKDKGFVSRGMIGVQIQDVNRELAQTLGLPRTGGALVNATTAGSAAEKAGIKVGDVILAFGGVDVADHRCAGAPRGAAAGRHRADGRQAEDQDGGRIQRLGQGRTAGRLGHAAGPSPGCQPVRRGQRAQEGRLIPFRDGSMTAVPAGTAVAVSGLPAPSCAGRGFMR